MAHTSQIIYNLYCKILILDAFILFFYALLFATPNSQHAPKRYMYDACPSCNAVVTDAANGIAVQVYSPRFDVFPGPPLSFISNNDSSTL